MRYNSIMELQQAFYVLAIIFMTLALALLVTISVALWRIYAAFTKFREKGNLIARVVGNKVRGLVRKR